MTGMVSIQTKLVVSNGAVTNWVPKTETVDGLVFMMLNKWDRKFIKFCGGTLRFGRGSPQGMNYSFLDRLVRLRTEASDVAFRDAVQVPRPDPDDPRPTRRRRVRRARAADVAIAGRVVTIQHTGRVMKVLFGVRRTPLWIEATPGNLEYVEQGMRHAQDADELSAETDILPGGNDVSEGEQRNNNDDDDDNDDDDE